MSEILAPAGSMESVFAAVRNGANAVYLAGENFNARKGAQNFTAAELKQAVEYCHGRGVKVYHALNTLVKDREIGELKEEIKRILAIGGDALILQDLGVAKIVKAMCPEMPIHASTQLSAHSLSAVRALQKIGFKRVVLAREMSRKEIEYIRKNTDVELEIFVHGALCMCVSGQCYMSAFFGARSGNRGLCAQPCRLPFKAEGGTGHDLSLKDNSILNYLPELEKMGIDSFKIEGRMKRPEYVAASVSACKSALGGKLQEAETEKLKNIFSRQGFTDGYFTGKLGKNMFGSRTREDVTSATSSLLKQYAASYSKEQPLIKADIKISVKKDALPQISMSALGKSVSAQGENPPQAAINRELSEEELINRVSKLGGTQFFAGEVGCDLDRSLMLSAGEINSLRRKAVELLCSELEKGREYTETGDFPALQERKLPQNKKIYLRFSSLSQAQNIDSYFDKIILPIEECERAIGLFPSDKLILETPRVFFGGEKRLTELLDKAKSLGAEYISVGNIGALELARQRGFKIFASLGTNILNSYACAEVDADEILLSAEMSLSEISDIKTEKSIGNIVYGYIPLMITRNCPVKNGKSCQKCAGKSCITDRKGEKFPVRCRFGASEIFNPYALYMLDRLSEFKNTDFFLLYFTNESEKEVEKILNCYKTKAKPDFKFTRGLYSKGVL